MLLLARSSALRDVATTIKQHAGYHLRKPDKNLAFFGRYLQNVSPYAKRRFRLNQAQGFIPRKALGRTPSGASQVSLYHGDDFTSFRRFDPGSRASWQELKTNGPSVRVVPVDYTKTDFESKALGQTVFGIKVSQSARNAMDDFGGFDEYIQNCPPEDMRSNLGEKLQTVMHYYQRNPEVKKWKLPWKVYLRQDARQDPAYARYVHLAKKAASEKKRRHAIGVTSPYFLPKSNHMISATSRQDFLPGTQVQELDLWWKQSPELEAAFRRRLKEALPNEHKTPDNPREVWGYEKGKRRGGGGMRREFTPRKQKGNYGYLVRTKHPMDSPWANHISIPKRFGRYPRGSTQIAKKRSGYGRYNFGGG